MTKLVFFLLYQLYGGVVASATEVVFLHYDDEFTNEVKVSLQNNKIQFNQNANMFGGPALTGEFSYIARGGDKDVFKSVEQWAKAEGFKRKTASLEVVKNDSFEVYVNGVGVHLNSKSILRLRLKIKEWLRRPLYKKNKAYHLQLKPMKSKTDSSLKLKVQKYDNNTLVYERKGIPVDESFCSGGAFTGVGHCQTPYGAFYFQSHF